MTKWNRLRAWVVVILIVTGCALLALGDSVWFGSVLTVATFVSAFIDDTEREASEQGFHPAA